MLRRRLTIFQWMALFFLACGTAYSQARAPLPAPVQARPPPTARRPFLPACASAPCLGRPVSNPTVSRALPQIPSAEAREAQAAQMLSLSLAVIVPGSHGVWSVAPVGHAEPAGQSAQSAWLVAPPELR